MKTNTIEIGTRVTLIGDSSRVGVVKLLKARKRIGFDGKAIEYCCIYFDDFIDKQGNAIPTLVPLDQLRPL